MKIPVPPRDRVPIFCGGIGDVFMQCCTTDRYRILSNEDGPEVVVNASRNEFAWELFKWHPRAQHFKVINAVQPPTSPWSKADFIAGLGLSPERLYEGVRWRTDWATPFYPSPKDQETLTRFSGRRFGIYAPFSKKQKSLSTELSENLLPALHDWPDPNFQLLGFGRNYQRVNLSFQDLSGFSSKGWLVDLCPFDLTVPGSFELARNAAFYVGANSCLALVSMSLGRPTVILEPENHTNPAAWQRLFDVESCLLIQKFSAVDPAAIIAFLEGKLSDCKRPRVSGSGNSLT